MCASCAASSTGPTQGDTEAYPGLRPTAAASAFSLFRCVGAGEEPGARPSGGLLELTLKLELAISQLVDLDLEVGGQVVEALLLCPRRIPALLHLQLEIGSSRPRRTELTPQSGDGRIEMRHL